MGVYCSSDGAVHCYCGARSFVYHLGALEMLEASELTSSLRGVGGRVILQAMDGGGDTLVKDEIIGEGAASDVEAFASCSCWLTGFVCCWLLGGSLPRSSWTVAFRASRSPRRARSCCSWCWSEALASWTCWY
jgi:hypothetical protein